MKKRNILSLLTVALTAAAISGPVKANTNDGKVSGNATISSDYIWRGIPFNNTTTLQAGFDYTRWGFTFGLNGTTLSPANFRWNSGVSDRTVMADWHVGYAHRLHEDLWIKPFVTWHTFMASSGSTDGADGLGSNGFLEGGLNFVWRWFDLGVAWTDQVFGWDTSSLTVSLDVLIDEEVGDWQIGFGGGMVSFADDFNMGLRSGAGTNGNTRGTDSLTYYYVSLGREFGNNLINMKFSANDREEVAAKSTAAGATDDTSTTKLREYKDTSLWLGVTHNF